MSTLTDPRICPDCRALLDSNSVCTGCGLVLQGRAAVALWEHLQQADLLIEHLRVTSGRPAPAMPPSPTTDLPTAPPSATQPRTSPKRPSLSVPVVLLGLGGICVLVAAIVFVAVTWSSLGLAGRTLIMIGVTTVAALAARLLTRRGLRGGAETMWLVTHVLLALDVVAAAAADLAGLGDLDSRHLVGGLGALLLLCALAVSAWATRTAVPRLSGMVAVTVVGTLLLSVAEAWAAERAAVGTAISVPVLGGAALLLSRLNGLRPHGYGVASVGAVSWVLLIGHGLSRSGNVTSATWWQDLEGWPLIVAALVATVAAVARAVPEPFRSVAAGAALGCLVLFAIGGTASGQTKVLVACGVASVLAAVAGLGPRVWAIPAALMVGLAALVGTTASLVRPWGVVADLPTSAPEKSTGLDLAFPATTWDLASWTAPVIAMVAALCLLALLRHLPAALRPEGRSTWIAIAPVLVGLGLVTWFLESEPQLLPGVSAWLALTVIAAGVTAYRGKTDGPLLVCLAMDVYLLAVALRLCAPSHLLVAVVSTAAAATLAVAARYVRVERLGGLLVSGLSGAWAATAFLAAAHWPYLAGPTGDTASNASALTLAVVASAVGLAASRFGRTPAARITLEAAALAAGLIATALTADQLVAAAVLTIVGTAVAGVSILNRDRDLASWVASGLLAVAVLIRAEDGAVSPELVALPAAALLVAVGVRRLLTDPDVSSYRALSSGLTLGLTPSLIGTLDDPVSVRGALVAAAGLGILGLGIRCRWAAPFIAGAFVVAVVAVRHLGPVAAALPRWISLGSVGIVLLLVGVTWEARRRDAKKAERYLTALR